MLDFLEESLEKSINAIQRPFEDAICVAEGLTEGQLRKKAAARLGADIVAGMLFSEVVDFIEGN